MKALFACALALAAVPAVARENAPAAAAESRDIAAIRAVGMKWRSLYEAGRYAEIPELYTLDTMVMPRGRPRITGREAMRRAIGGLAAGRRVAIEITEREIHAAGDMGWFIGDFRVTYTPAGAPPVTEFGRSLIIYRRDTDGQWRVHRDMDSPAPHLGAASDTTPMWDPKSRTDPTACDRLASSRYDRTRLAPPMARSEIDVSRAIGVCEADLAKLPGDPRLHFHLGRLYGYAGDAAKTLFHRRAAAAAGNHNAIFLLGYLDFAAATDDTGRCAAARAIKLAADRGNYSGQLTYASYLTEGKLDACPDRAGLVEAAAYVAAAKPQVDGFFETRLADHLAAELSGTAADRARLERQQAGVWTGIFRRYDAGGSLIEAVPSEVRIAFAPEGYRQTNILRRPGKPEERIDSAGTWDGDKLRFSNARVEGWYGPLVGDTAGLVSVLQMTFKGPQPLMMSELITVSSDGNRRMRIAQYVQDGRIVRRTLIDETRSAGPEAR